MSSSTQPIYNLNELGLEEYEKNDLVLNTIHDLKLFFQEISNCTCRHFLNKKIQEHVLKR